MNIAPYSYSRKQDFMWVGEYANGTTITEFDPNTKEPVSFYSIDKPSLIRFGLVGHGMRLFYEVFGGFYKLQGQMIELIYKDGDKEYYLTGQPKAYNDIITYKDAEATASLPVIGKSGKVIGGEGKFHSRIVQYNFGYKTSLEIYGVRFNLKTLVSLPFNSPAYLRVRLVADRGLNGQLVIKKNGFVTESFDAPLQAGVGGELNWIIR